MGRGRCHKGVSYWLQTGWTLPPVKKVDSCICTKPEIIPAFELFRLPPFGLQLLSDPGNNLAAVWWYWFWNLPFWFEDSADRKLEANRVQKKVFQVTLYPEDEGLHTCQTWQSHRTSPGTFLGCHSFCFFSKVKLKQKSCVCIILKESMLESRHMMEQQQLACLKAWIFDFQQDYHSLVLKAYQLLKEQQNYAALFLPNTCRISLLNPESWIH
jgi:hypothetical protein